MWAFLGGFDWHVKFRSSPFVQVTGCTNTLLSLEKRLSSKPGRGILRSTFIEVINDRKQVVLFVESTTLMATSSE